MATKYCDLDLTGIGGDGSEGNPWTGEQFAGIIRNYAAADTILIKGSVSTPSVADPNWTQFGPAVACDLVLSPWGNSPWFIEDNQSGANFWKVTIIGMHIRFTSSNPGFGAQYDNGTVFYSCHISGPQHAYAFTQNANGGILSGCTIDTTLDLWTSGDVIKDCIFLVPPIVENASTPTFNNCVLPGAQPAHGTFNDCQFSWTPPTWPAWDDSLSADWNATTLSASITTPPEPGNPPYTNYDTDAWGNSRTGIGALNFLSVVAPVADFTGTPVTGTVPLSVSFLDTSTNTPTSWDWDFGDGSTHSTSQNPTHSYATVGSFTVTLIATNAGGSDTEAKVNYVTSSIADKKPGETKNPDDSVGMPRGGSDNAGSPLKDTKLGNGHAGDSLDKNKLHKLGDLLRDLPFQGNDGSDAKGKENNNGVKGLLQQLPQLAQTITDFFYKVR